MFCALTELCILCDIPEIYTLYDRRIERILRRLDCEPAERTDAYPIDGKDTFVGRFIPDKQMLLKIQAASGIREQLISEDDLPPTLHQRFERNINQKIARSV